MSMSRCALKQSIREIKHFDYIYWKIRNTENRRAKCVTQEVKRKIKRATELTHENKKEVTECRSEKR